MKAMYREFCRFVRSEKLFEGKRKFLLALSGGVDSVVLAHLMARFSTADRLSAFLPALPAEGGDGAGTGKATDVETSVKAEVGLVHCNFQLRGSESDRDEAFVRDLAGKWARIPGWKLFVEKFDTRAYAKEKGISIEMAARELRYGFFSRLMKESGYEACLLAHHADDNAETFFLNLFRGSGVKGLRGMLPASGENGAFLRPLLFARRKDIAAYALCHHLDFVEDSTNREEIYLRNRLRHSVLPLLEQVCPGFSCKLAQSMGTLREADALLDSWYREQAGRILKQAPVGKSRAEEIFRAFPDRALAGHFPSIQEFLPGRDLDALGRQKDLFWELYLRERGFSRKQIAQFLENCRQGFSGKLFGNTENTVWIVREPQGWRSLFFFPEKGANACDPLRKLVSSDLRLVAREATGMAARAASLCGKPGNGGDGPACRQYPAEVESLSRIDPSPRKAYLAFEKLEFPLFWRHWQAGDRFKPLGSKGFRKLSDFFKDAKLGSVERESVWLLCSGQAIVWVAGYRIDERYKINFPCPGKEERPGTGLGTGEAPVPVSPRKAWVVELL